MSPTRGPHQRTESRPEPGGRENPLPGRTATSATARPGSMGRERPLARSFRPASITLSFRVAYEDESQGPHRSFRLTPATLGLRRPVQAPGGGRARVSASSEGALESAEKIPASRHLRRVDSLCILVSNMAILAALVLLALMVAEVPLGPIKAIVATLTR